MTDVTKIHESRCPNFNTVVQVSSDGVSENKSSINVLDVYSIRFDKCRMIYPCQIVRPIGKFKVDQRTYLDNFLTNVCCAKCHIAAFIGDNPKRVIAREGMGHSSYYPCEYCTCKGTLYKDRDSEVSARKNELIKSRSHLEEKIQKLNYEDQDNEEEIAHLMTVLKNVSKSIKDLNKKKGHIVWPKESFHSEPRSKENVADIAEKIQNEENLTKDEKKGIVGRSLFLDIPYFDLITDIPAEYLHGSCLGVSKKLIELTFDVGDNRKRVTKRKLSSHVTFNLLMAYIKSPFEFSRRIRSLDFSVMKGQEFRNITIFFFPSL